MMFQSGRVFFAVTTHMKCQNTSFKMKNDGLNLKVRVSSLNIPIINYDVYLGVIDYGLKTMEAYMGLNIEESGS